MDGWLIALVFLCLMGILGYNGLKRARPELFGLLSRAGQMFYRNELFAFEYSFTPSDALSENVSRALHRIYDKGLFDGAIIADQLTQKEHFLAAAMAAIIYTNERDDTPFYKTELRLEEAVGAMRIDQVGEARKIRQSRIALVENTFHKKK